MFYIDKINYNLLVDRYPYVNKQQQGKIHRKRLGYQAQRTVIKEHHNPPKKVAGIRKPGKIRRNRTNEKDPLSSKRRIRKSTGRNRSYRTRKKGNILLRN